MANESYQISLVTLASLVIRWCVSIYPHSGQGKPPMHGDYEAQRHWQEITVNLPTQDWYRNTTDNDLLYWGLDYPPLTAYHSWICGIVAKKISPSWIQLFSSRGIEDSVHKLFMRSTVILVDLFVFFPAVFLYFYGCTRHTNRTAKVVCSLVTLLYPGLVLIDHGHFQYNSMSLGLTLWAVVFLDQGSALLGSIAFCLALNYKQMELYHAMPFFAYLLGTCFQGKLLNGFVRLVKIGTVVLLTFALIWSPFLKSVESGLQVANRLFPFARGLYEDKVANFWCSISVIVKLKQIFTQDQTILMCLMTTVLALLPTSINLLWKPSVHRFKIALVNASLVFFLFSFQVHEKSILIPALSVCLLLPESPLMCSWFLLVSTFSMVPLLIKDGLVIPYFATMFLFILIISQTFDLWSGDSVPDGFIKRWTQGNFGKFLFCTSVLGMIICSVTALIVPPPKRLPDLFPVLISVYSCAHFLLFLVYFHWWQFACRDHVMHIKSSPSGRKQPNANKKKHAHRKKVQ